MPASKPAPSSGADVAGITAALEHMLRAQLEDHRRLLACIERKRHAIRGADVAAIEAVRIEEEPIARRVIESQQQLTLVRERLSSIMRPQSRSAMTLSEIAAAAGGEQHSRLTTLATQLRDVVMQVKKQSAVVRAAAEALSRHLGGIAQSVNSALSRARVYGNRGSIALGAPVSSSLDIKS